MLVTYFVYFRYDLGTIHTFYFFFWSKGIIFKFNVTELFCFLIRTMCAAFEVAATCKSCDILLECKNQILAHNIFFNKHFQQISVYR